MVVLCPYPDAGRAGRSEHEGEGSEDNDEGCFHGTSEIQSSIYRRLRVWRFSIYQAMAFIRRATSSALARELNALIRK